MSNSIPQRSTHVALWLFLTALHAAFWLAFAVVLTSGGTARGSEPIVPGTGQKVAQVGDDFEEEDWEFYQNNPKSSYEQDKQQRLPGGESKNGRWYEGMKRGHPDVVKRVKTPDGGLPGSTHSLLLQTLKAGIPGNRPTFTQQQDDFVCNIADRLGGSIPIWQCPNWVVRVYLPPVDKWEKRTGSHFGIRSSVDTTVNKTKRSFLTSRTSRERETYWPGFFVEFESKANGFENNYANLILRCDENGQDYKVKQITKTGWWTFGMSFTADGQVHYYAKPGVEDLTSSDRIASQFPYGFRCERFETIFFNVCNGDDQRTWSSALIIDDPTLYFIPRKGASEEQSDR